MRTNDFEYFTYETDGLGITDVYGWARYRKGPLVGQPRKMWIALYQTLEEVKEKYPGIYDTHPAFE